MNILILRCAILQLGPSAFSAGLVVEQRCDPMVKHALGSVEGVMHCLRGSDRINSTCERVYEYVFLEFFTLGEVNEVAHTCQANVPYCRGYR